MSRDIYQRCCIYVSDIDSECEYDIMTLYDKSCSGAVPFYKIDTLADKGYIRYTVYRRPLDNRYMGLKSHRIFDMSLKADDLATLELMYESPAGGPFNNHGIKQIDDIV